MAEHLWSPTRHEPLSNLRWDEGYVRNWLNSIIAETIAVYQKFGGWPVHPRDYMGGIPEAHANSLYYGAGGVIWGLKKLETVLQISLPIDLMEAAHRCYLSAKEHPDAEEPGLLLSRGGTELLPYAFGDSSVKQELKESIHACGQLENPKEIFWGAPAALLLAYHAFQVEKDHQWMELFIHHGQRFLQNIGLEKRERWEWPQHLYGAVRPCIGAAHGFVGALLPFMLAYPELPPEMQNQLFEPLIQCLQDTVLETDNYANWAKLLPTDGQQDSEYLMQWCHGAPGIVSCLSYLPTDKWQCLETLMLKAGEAIWAAGPLLKPSGLCHGTAGNAYAFMRLHALSGDKRWLERARYFGMYAIQQSITEKAEKQQSYYSLLTGDIGLAVFLADCILALPGNFPVVESFSFKT